MCDSMRPGSVTNRAKPVVPGSVDAEKLDLLRVSAVRAMA